MKHDNFENLNGVIFTLMKSVLTPGNQSSFEILQLFDTLRYQSLVILYFSSVWI